MALAAGNVPYGTAIPAELAESVDDRTLADATRAIVESLADAGGYVVLGRGAQAALAGRRDVCHLSLVADQADRVRQVMTWNHVENREAARRCSETDAERAAYVRRFYGRDIRDPLLYDAVLNTSLLGLDGATEIAITIARRKLALA